MVENHIIECVGLNLIRHTDSNVSIVHLQFSPVGGTRKLEVQT